jgi:hypothetical protein
VGPWGRTIKNKELAGKVQSFLSSDEGKKLTAAEYYLLCCKLTLPSHRNHQGGIRSRRTLGHRDHIIKAVAASRWALILLDDPLVNGEISGVRDASSVRSGASYSKPINVSLPLVATLNIFDLAVKKIRRKVKLELVE